MHVLRMTCSLDGVVATWVYTSTYTFAQRNVQANKGPTFPTLLQYFHSCKNLSKCEMRLILENNNKGKMLGSEIWIVAWMRWVVEDCSVDSIAWDPHVATWWQSVGRWGSQLLYPTLLPIAKGGAAHLPCLPVHYRTCICSSHLLNLQHIAKLCTKC